jgi:hypothetical protein
MWCFVAQYYFTRLHRDGQFFFDFVVIVKTTIMDVVGA